MKRYAIQDEEVREALQSALAETVRDRRSAFASLLNLVVLRWDVLAIFPDPWTVVTDKRPFGTSRSACANLFFAGPPTRSELFAPPAD